MKRMEVYESDMETSSGTWKWMISDDDRGIAVSTQSFATRREAIEDLFSIFFAEYENTSTLALYGEYDANRKKLERLK